MAATDASDTIATAPPAPTVGDILRQARLARGEELGSIADTIRIRQKLLQAIEENRHGELPGGIYTIGFVRSYGQYLNLDIVALESQWRREAEALTRRAEYRFPTPTLERRLPGSVSILFGLLIVAGLIAIAVYSGNRNGNIVTNIPPLPDSLEHLVGDISVPEIDLPFGTASDDLAQPLDAAGLPQTSSAATGTAGDAPQPGVTVTKNAESFGADPAAAIFSLYASRDVWVQVRDSVADQIILTRVLHSGDRYFVPDQQGLLLTVGDAGAIEARLGAGRRAILGNNGEVIRDITLTRAGIESALR